MKTIITLCLSLIASVQFVQAESIVIGNNSEVDFSSLSSESSQSEFTIENKSINSMITGNVTVLISHLKWDDTHMADYQQRYGSNPKQLVIAAFDNRATNDAKATEDKNSTDAAKEQANAKDSKEKQALSSQELAEAFSTRDGSTLLYLYISEFESDKTSNNIGLFFTEDAQDWFTKQGLIAIPQPVHQQNLVTLGLEEPQFVGGYK